MLDKISSTTGASSLLSASSSGWSRGYFVFPPGLGHSLGSTPDHALLSPVDSSSSDGLDAKRRDREAAWEERCRREAKAREERLARERAEALVGEMDWVRAGFSLRDDFGRVDIQRTEELRREVRLQDEERRKTQIWEGYEARWKKLLASDGLVTFADIPWPTASLPSSVRDFNDDAIDDFILATLDTRKNTITRRERIRTSLLRWHPDKMTKIMPRVRDEDMQAVQEGVNAVFRRLKALQDMDKQA